MVKRGLSALALIILVMAGGCATGPAPSGGKAAETYVQGVYAYRSGNEDGATENLRQALQANPNLIMPRVILGRIYKDKGDYVTAASYYETLVQMDPYEVDHRYQLGVSYQMLERLKESARAYQGAIRLDPGNFGSNMNLGLVYLALGEVDQAVRYTQRAAELRPTSAEAQANLAVALDSAAEYEKAELAYRRSLDLAPKQAGTLTNYANNLITQEKWQAAQEVLRDLLKTEDTPYLRKRLGDTYAIAKKYELALMEYEEALKRNPKYYVALNEEARVLILQYQQGMELDEKQREAALERWRRSLEVNPNQPRIKILLEQWGKRMFSK